MFAEILAGLQTLGDRVLQWVVAFAIAVPIDALIIVFNRKTFEKMIGVNKEK